MTLNQLVIILNWLIAIGIPLAVSLVTHVQASAGVKAMTNLGLTGISTAVTSIVAALVAHRPIDWFTIIFAFVTSFIVACAAYARVWKPIGTTDALALRGASVGKHVATD